MSTLKSLLTSAQKAYKAGEYEAALDCCKRMPQRALTPDEQTRGD